MDAVESSSPPWLRHKLRTTVCGCFGSQSSQGEKPNNGGGRARWRRRVAAPGEFRYDPFSYALNFDDGDRDSEDTTFRYRDFTSRLPPSPRRHQQLGGSPPSPLPELNRQHHS